MQKVDVKIVKWIEEGFTLYKNNFATLVLASVIALVLSMVTIGILAGPMIAGLIIVTLQLLRKEKPNCRKCTNNNAKKRDCFTLNAMKRPTCWVCWVVSQINMTG